MKSFSLLSNSLMKEVLDYLDCPIKMPSLRYLNWLIQAYIRTVPWESVSRIVKRHITPQTRDCPRWPEMLSYVLAVLFQMPEDKISAILSWIQSPRVKHFKQPEFRPMIVEGSS